MALIATQRPGLAVLSTVFVAANAGGDTFQNDGRTLLRYKNTSGAPITVTVDDPTSVLAGAQAFNPDVQFVVPATTGDVTIGPFPPARFGDVLAVTYSGVTSLTVAAVGA